MQYEFYRDWPGKSIAERPIAALDAIVLGREP
jgi:hypothetical protein